jgi:4'-phosphopantetheinyl transferase EntD
VIELILPDTAASVDTREDWKTTSLYRDEQEALGRVVDARRDEFTTARECAHRALARLGLPPSPIAKGSHGEPRWPAGIVGSITHCERYRACALARKSEIVTVGIDAEPHGALPDGVLGEIASRKELAWLTELIDVEPGVYWDRLLFSVKESVYKAWFPLARCALRFEDVLVTIEPTSCTFYASLLNQGLPVREQRTRTLHGRWLVCDGLILTAIALPTPATLLKRGLDAPSSHASIESRNESGLRTWFST